MLGTDEGARRLGEVAFGLNYEIDRFTHNTLFDEKIGGTMHVALGSAFDGAGRRRTSRRCTGTWSATCARTARSTPTASSSGGPGASSSSRAGDPTCLTRGSLAWPTSWSATRPELKQGELILLEAPVIAEPLFAELYRAVLEAGGLPMTRVGLDLAEVLLKEGSDEQIAWVNPARREGIERPDVRIVIEAATNTKALTSVEPARQALVERSRLELRDRYLERALSGALAGS